MKHKCGCLWILEEDIRALGVGVTGVCKLWVQGTEIRYSASVASAVNYSSMVSSCYFQFLFFLTS